MWSEKSFQDILLEKMRSQTEEKIPSENSESNTHTARLNSSYSSAAWTPGYWQISRPESPRVAPASAYPTKPYRPSVQWAPEQIAIINEFIELGAQLATDSHCREIKREYRRLLVKYHPDHCHGADELTVARHSRTVQKVIRLFKEFNALKANQADKKGSEAAA